MKRLAATCLVLAALLHRAPAAEARGFDEDSRAIAAVHALLAPSIVHVRVAVRSELSSGRAVETERECSGVVVDADGTILVPGSVLEGASSLGARVLSVEVTVAGGRRFEAAWAGRNSARQLAFVRVADPDFPGAPAEFAADDALSVGAFLASVRLTGPSFGRIPYVEAFMVSAVVDEPRCYATTFAVSDYLGSAVATLDGRIVGVVGWMNLRSSVLMKDPVSGAAETSMFAPVFGENPAGSEIVIVPATFVKQALHEPRDPDVAAGGSGAVVEAAGGADAAEAGSGAAGGDDPVPADARRRPPFLGVEVQVMLPELRAALGLPATVHGVFVTRVLPRSPAERAGLTPDDLIVAVGGLPLRGERENEQHYFAARLLEFAPGDEVRLEVLRDGVSRTATATLGQAPLTVAEAPSARCEAVGVTARDLVYMDAVDLRLGDDARGARVTAVNPAGAAGVAGLRVGDVVVRVNAAEVESSDHLSRLLERGAGESQMLFVRRGRTTLFVQVD